MDSMLPDPWRKKNSWNEVKHSWNEICEKPKNEVQTHKLCKYAGIRNINIVGEISSGKSSFFNYVELVFGGHVTRRANSGSVENSLTTKYRQYVITAQDQRKKPIKFKFCDSMGLEDENGGLSGHDIGKILDDHVKELAELSHGVMPGNAGYNANPTEDILILRARQILRNSEREIMEIKERIKKQNTRRQESSSEEDNGRDNDSPQEDQDAQSNSDSSVEPEVPKNRRSHSSLGDYSDHLKKRISKTESFKQPPAPPIVKKPPPPLPTASRKGVVQYDFDGDRRDGKIHHLREGEEVTEITPDQGGRTVVRDAAGKKGKAPTNWANLGTGGLKYDQGNLMKARRPDTEENKCIEDDDTPASSSSRILAKEDGSKLLVLLPIDQEDQEGQEQLVWLDGMLQKNYPNMKENLNQMILQTKLWKESLNNLFEQRKPKDILKSFQNIVSWDPQYRAQHMDQLYENIEDLYQHTLDGTIPKDLFTEENVIILNDVFYLCCKEHHDSEVTDATEHLSSYWYKMTREMEIAERNLKEMETQGIENRYRKTNNVMERSTNDDNQDWLKAKRQRKY